MLTMWDQGFEPVITLEGEEITCLKFNRYDYPWGIDDLCSKYDDEIKNIYRDRENQLIVCSYKMPLRIIMEECCVSMM